MNFNLGIYTLCLLISSEISHSAHNPLLFIKCLTIVLAELKTSYHERLRVLGQTFIESIFYTR
jgi:hypothetical protein